MDVCRNLRPDATPGRRRRRQSYAGRMAGTHPISGGPHSNKAKPVATTRVVFNGSLV